MEGKKVAQEAGLIRRDPNAAKPAAAPPARQGFAPTLAVRVWKAADPTYERGLTPDALPLRAGDKVRVEAAVNPPGYAYLIWIDTEGQASPVYPWKPGKWGTRPEVERPVARVSLPESADKGWPIGGAEDGMETLVLLVRDAPLPAGDDDLRGRLAGLPPQRPLRSPTAVSWFEDGLPTAAAGTLRAPVFEEGAIDDPVVRAQALLRERLQPLAACTRAVGFAKTGK